LLKPILEALLFSATQPISLSEIIQVLQEHTGLALKSEQVAPQLEAIRLEYEDEQHGFMLMESGGGWRFLTKPAHYNVLATHHRLAGRRKLSPAALETLSIVAYRQPITKSEIEQIRGVSSDYAIQKLLERELISIKGKSDLPGRPLLYETSRQFIDYLGINNLTQLPQLKDLTAEPDSKPMLAGITTESE